MTAILTIILNWLAGKVVAFLIALGLREERRSEADKQAQADEKPIEQAQTAKEIDDAAEDQLNHF